MKKLEKYIIISIFIIILTIIATIFLILNLNKTKNIGEDGKTDALPADTSVEELNTTPVDNDTKFYTIANCVKTYYRYLGLDVDGKNTITSDLLSVVNIKSQEEKKQVLLNLLDSEYKSKNNITEANIYDFTGDFSAILSFTVLKMNAVVKDNIEKYAVYGRLQAEADTGIKIGYRYLIVTYDKNNSSFSIYLLDSEKYKNIDDIELNINIEKVEKNDNNKVTILSRNDQEKAMQLFAMYKEDVQYDSERAYNSLNKEYREKRFGNLEEYKKYISDNIDYIRSCNFSKSSVSENKSEGYKQYICTDVNGNYYIFREKSIMNYELLLDTYTIEIPEFLNTYNSASDERKASLNINSFMQALNGRDYKFAYNILNESFRGNNFRTQADFEKYVKNEFFDINKIKSIECTQNGNYYVCNVKFTNKSTSSEKEKSFTVFLGEGTNFELSFNLD